MQNLEAFQGTLEEALLPNERLIATLLCQSPCDDRGMKTQPSGPACVDVCCLCHLVCPIHYTE